MNTKTKICLKCDSPVYQRGLCSTCYGRFTRAKNRLPEEKHKAFEDALIATGKLAAPKKREPGSFDEYAELADELKSANPQEVREIVENYRTTKRKSQKPTVQQEADDVARKAKKAAKRKGITPKNKSE